MTDTPKPRSTGRRLDPELRRNMILDRTAMLIAREGVSAVSMERIGREAGVSKALIYVYFKNQTALLQSLLLREQRRLTDQQSSAVGRAGDFKETVFNTTRTYLRYFEENGILLQRLLNEPSLAAAFEEHDRAERPRVVNTLARQMAETYDLPLRVAKVATELSMAMTGAAGGMISRGEISSSKVEEIILCLFDGSMTTLSERFGKNAAKVRLAADPKPVVTGL